MNLIWFVINLIMNYLFVDLLVAGLITGLGLGHPLGRGVSGVEGTEEVPLASLSPCTTREGNIMLTCFVITCKTILHWGFLRTKLRSQYQKSVEQVLNKI